MCPSGRDRFNLRQSGPYLWIMLLTKYRKKNLLKIAEYGS